MTIEARDTLDNVLNVGDIIVYASRPYSGVHLTKAVIREIIEGELDYWGNPTVKLKVDSYKYGPESPRRTTLSMLDRVAKVVSA